MLNLWFLFCFDFLLWQVTPELLFSNLPSILSAHQLFWQEVIYPMLQEVRRTGMPFDPMRLEAGCLQVWIHCLQDTLQTYSEVCFWLSVVQCKLSKFTQVLYFHTVCFIISIICYYTYIPPHFKYKYLYIFFIVLLHYLYLTAEGNSYFVD